MPSCHLTRRRKRWTASSRDRTVVATETAGVEKASELAALPGGRHSDGAFCSEAGSLGRVGAFCSEPVGNPGRVGAEQGDTGGAGDTEQVWEAAFVAVPGGIGTDLADHICRVEAEMAHRTVVDNCTPCLLIL